MFQKSLEKHQKKVQEKSFQTLCIEKSTVRRLNHYSLGFQRLLFLRMSEMALIPLTVLETYQNNLKEPTSPKVSRTLESATFHRDTSRFVPASLPASDHQKGCNMDNDLRVSSLLQGSCLQTHSPFVVAPALAKTTQQDFLPTFRLKPS